MEPLLLLDVVLLELGHLSEVVPVVFVDEVEEVETEKVAEEDIEEEEVVMGKVAEEVIEVEEVGEKEVKDIEVDMESL